MISITHLFSKDNRITASNQVSLSCKGAVSIGRVLACNYSANEYIVQYTDWSLNTVVRSFKRHLLTNIEDVAHEEIVTSVQELASSYETEEFVHLEMMS